MEPMHITLIVLVIFVVTMLSGKFSFGVIAIACSLLLALTGVIEPLEAFSAFSNQNVILMGGMFILAYAFGKTSLVDVIQKKLLARGGGKSELAIAATILIISVLLSQYIASQVSVMMIMMAFLMSLGNTGSVTTSRMMLPMTFCVTMWLGRLPIGAMGVSGYIMYNGYIEAAGGTELLNMFSTIKATWLPAVASLIYCIFTYKMLPNKEADLSAYTQRGKGGEKQTLSKKNEIIIYVCFVGAIVAMLCANWIGNFMYIAPAIAAVIMILLGAISSREALNCLANDALFMAAGVFVLADAMTNSGAGALIGDVVISILGGSPSPFLILLVVAVATTIMTTFTSNTATIFVLVPIVCNICVAAGYDPRACILCCMTCAVSSVITPMASNGAAVAYAAANLSIKDTIKWSVPLTLLTMVCAIANAYFAYPM